MKTFKAIALAAVAAVTVGSAASAATISSTGDFLEIATPASVTNSLPASSTNILYYNELQNFTLAMDLVTDQGTISAGTAVDSHMMFLNKPDNVGGTLQKGGTLTFASQVLGTVSDINGVLMSASDYLGGGTAYTNFNNRGLEGNDTVSFLGDTVTANFLIVTQPGDWVRVVTAAAPVPVPAALPLLLAGLGGLGFMARRKKRKAA